jgi:ABC-2 type transport system ATP-binding protein
MIALQAEGISKSFNNNKALENVSFSITKGRIFALIGPNGAGKTTFVKSLLNLIRLDSGQITINGVKSTKKTSRSNISYLPERFSFYSYYSVQDVLKFYGKMKGLRGRQLDEKIEQALESMNLTKQRKQKVKDLSKGQNQRLGIANLVMGDNDLFILDEPFSGLDPIGIKDLKDFMRRLKTQGKTVFISSHILSELEQICEDVVILDQGRIVREGKLSTLLQGKSLEELFHEEIKGESV